MSADCPGCWPTPKLPITRVTPGQQANRTALELDAIQARATGDYEAERRALDARALDALALLDQADHDA